VFNFRLWLALAIAGGIAIFLSVTGFTYVRDVDALLDRAQVAADREDMLEYLTKLRNNMQHHGMTMGHTAVIFRTPANDMALHYKTVGRIIERLEGIKRLPKYDTAYQVALDDIRGTIRELPNPAGGWTWARWWILFFLCGAACIWAFFEISLS